MSGNSQFHLTSAVAVLLASSCLVSPTLAQVQPEQDPSTEKISDDADSGLQEITVVAERRAASLDKVGLTVSAISTEDIAKKGIKETADVITGLPNINVNYGVGLTSFNIRGVGSNQFAVNFDSPVAVHLDEIYLSKSVMTDMLLFDVAGVEVSSGPQGTLFGRNTTGGTVNFRTNRPTFILGAGGQIGYGNYDTIRGEGFVNAPLGNQFALRVSAFGNHQGEGYYRNLTLNETEGYERKYAMRGQLLFDNGSTNALLSGHYGRSKGTLPPSEGGSVYTADSYARFNPNGGLANIPLLTKCAEYLDGTVRGDTMNCVRGEDGLRPGDNDPFTSNSHHKLKVNNTGAGASLRIEQELGAATLTSISAYEYFHRQNVGLGDGGPTYFGTWGFWDSRIKQYTQEFRLAGDTGSWAYSIGAFYERDDMTTDNYLTLGDRTTPALRGFKTDFKQTTDAAALFTHNKFDVTQRLKLVAGARVSYERITVDGGTCSANGIQGGDIKDPVNGCIASLSQSALIPGGPKVTAENVSFKVGAEWSPKVDGTMFDSLLVYGNLSSGFRSGSFNADLATTQAAFTKLNPEEITAYELGFKSVAFDRRLRLQASLFRYNAKDGFLRVDNGISPVPVTINAANISTWGAEASVTLLLMPGLEANLTGGWLDAKIKGNVTSAGLNLNGNRPINAPKFSFGGGLDYTTAIGSDYELNLNTNVAWKDGQYLDVTNSPVGYQKPYWIVNTSASFGPADGSWKVTSWVKNLTKSTYRTYMNDLAGFGFTLNTYAPPRTYGVTLGFDF